MKRLLLIILLLFPLTTQAKELEVVSHLIDSEIEIGGGLNVKELIITEGEGNFIQRTVNYYSFGTDKWDEETVNLDNGSIYNGQSISIVSVSAYEVGDTVDFNAFSKNITNKFKPFDIKDPSDETYMFEDNKNGEASIKIFYPNKGKKKIAYYINYVVTNVVVKHEDVKEINYTFKNLNYNSPSTLLRVIIPYPTTSDLYHVWVHGNNSGKVEELVNKNEQKLGIIASFPETKGEVNFRMTLEPEQVGVDMFLNKSNKVALKDIIKLEDKRQNKTNYSNKVVNIMKYALVIIGALYVIGSFLFLKTDYRILYYVYLAFGLFIMLFNYLFGFNYWYLYLILIMPLLIGLKKKYFVK